MRILKGGLTLITILALLGQTNLVWGAANDYDYSIYQKSDNPVIKQGEKVILWAKIQNTGQATWYGDRATVNTANPIRLGTVEPTDRHSSFFTQDNWIANNRVHKADEEEIAPGEIASFGFYATAPSNMNPGVYHECFAPVVENVTWLANKGICWDITVEKNTDDKTYQAEVINDYDTSFIQLAPGEQKKITLKAKNVGTATWTREGQYPMHLATDKPKDQPSVFSDTNWLSENRLTALNEENIKPGGMGSFSFTLTAPADAEPGEWYYEYYRLVAEGKQWLGDSDSLDAFYCGGKNLGEKSAYIQCADYYDGFMVVVSIVEDVTKIKTNVGEDFTINLDSNGTTGYAWEITQQPDENIIKLDKSGYEEICPDDLVGCGNPQYWTYKAQKEGETELELQYRRSWESADQAIQKKIYKIVVLSKVEAQNNLQKMTENLAEVKSMEYNGEFKMTNEEPKINLDINFKGGTDENTIDNPLGYFWLGFDLLNAEEDLNYQGDLEWRMIDKANYWKLNYENEVEDSDLSKYLKVINNQWIKIDEASAKETLEQINLGLVDEDLLDWQEALTGEQNEQIEELNKKYQIIKATKILADEQIGTVSTYHYQYMIDMEEINQLMEEMNQILSPEMNPYRSMNMDDMENITGKIWVGKNDLLPYKMTVEMNQAAEMEIDNLDFVLYFENFNKSLTVETPSSVKTWEEILAELEEIDKIA